MIEGEWAEEAEEHSFLMCLYNPNQSAHLRGNCINYMEPNPFH